MPTRMKRGGRGLGARFSQSCHVNNQFAATSLHSQGNDSDVELVGVKQMRALPHYHSVCQVLTIDWRKKDYTF